MVGLRGAVSRWLIPFSRQIRSKRVSESGWPKRLVKTLPLSVRISSGTPWRSIAAIRWAHTGRRVALAITPAQTTKRLWSSMPVRIFASTPASVRTPPTTSICQSSIERPLSQRV